MKTALTIILLLLCASAPKAQHRTTIEITNFDNTPHQKMILESAGRLLESFNEAYSKGSIPEMTGVRMTASAKNNILALWQTAPFICTETKIAVELVKNNNGNMDLRSVPLVLQKETDAAEEEGVLIFNSAGVLEDMYFGLETQQYKKLLMKGVNVADFRRRQIILDFVENFRTAYNRKDASYIESVFSDNALIIVGRVVQQQDNGIDLLERNLPQADVQLIKMNKQDYIKNLKATFTKNTYIKVGFDKIDIMQHRKYTYLYGVTLEQKWESTTYSDKGYIFLMIDFKTEEKPIIHVRSWQPKAFTKEAQVLSLGDFEIIE